MTSEVWIQMQALFKTQSDRQGRIPANNIIQGKDKRVLQKQAKVI